MLVVGVVVVMCFVVWGESVSGVRLRACEDCNQSHRHTETQGYKAARRLGFRDAPSDVKSI